MLVYTVFTKRMEVYMKNNKEHRIEFIKYNYIGEINRMLNNNGWYIINIYPVTPKDDGYGAYVWLERNKDIDLKEILEDLNIEITKSNDEYKSIAEILEEIS